MQKVSRFRGMAGEAACQFMSPKTLFSALSVLIVFAALHFATGMIGDLAGFIALPVYFLAYAMMVGRFSLPPLRGAFDSGSFAKAGNKLLFFIGRCLALNLVFVLPLALPVWMSIGRETLLDSAAGMLIPLASIQQSAANLPLTALVLASMLMLTLCFIVATRAETLREAFSREAWRWLLSKRRADLPIFYAALSGGLIIFFGIYLIPFALVFFLAFKISVQAGVAVSGFFYLLVLAASPVLLGRMCGAFVAGENDPENATENIENILALLGAAPSAGPRQQELALELEPPIEKKLSFDEMVAKTRALSVDALLAEIGKAEAALAIRPHDPYTAVELAMLYRKAGDTEKALAMATDAITQAMHDGYAEIGVSLFRGFAKERADLGLDAKTLDIIGNVLLKQGLMLDAGWCLHESALSAGYLLKAQKKLLHVASVAEETGKYAEAIALYNFVIDAYPDTNLAQYAKQGKIRTEAIRRKADN
ncbi:MAG: tetratricopeptide repeat protein [Gallionella sp.]|nr:tetratricopeptide repeat protein [Gallionella sp.]